MNRIQRIILKQLVNAKMRELLGSNPRDAVFYEEKGQEIQWPPLIYIPAFEGSRRRMTLDELER